MPTPDQLTDLRSAVEAVQFDAEDLADSTRNALGKIENALSEANAAEEVGRCAEEEDRDLTEDEEEEVASHLREVDTHLSNAVSALQAPSGLDDVVLSINSAQAMAE